MKTIYRVGTHLKKLSKPGKNQEKLTTRSGYKLIVSFRPPLDRARVLFNWYKETQKF